MMDFVHMPPHSKSVYRKDCHRGKITSWLPLLAAQSSGELLSLNWQHGGFHPRSCVHSIRFKCLGQPGNKHCINTLVKSNYWAKFPWLGLQSLVMVNDAERKGNFTASTFSSPVQLRGSSNPLEKAFWPPCKGELGSRALPGKMLTVW